MAGTGRYAASGGPGGGVDLWSHYRPCGHAQGPRRRAGGDSSPHRRTDDAHPLQGRPARLRPELAMTGLEEAALTFGAALLLRPPNGGAPTQRDIESLDLAGTQTSGPKGAAYALRHKFGATVVFTSGHRSIQSQVSAMAADIVQAGTRGAWIRKTYHATAISNAMAQWVDANPTATTKAA